MQVRMAYDDHEEMSLLTGLECQDESRTLQSQAQDADINVIVKRFNVTGQLPGVLKMPTYQDFDEVFDFRSALDVVRKAELAFLSVPANVRARFGNDPGAFVDFCMDERNIEELRRMGLAKSVETKVGVKDGEVRVEGASASAGKAAEASGGASGGGAVSE